LVFIKHRWGFLEAGLSAPTMRPDMTGGKYFNINVACLDGLDIDELMAAPVTYYDGHSDNWRSRPAGVCRL
jgi:hypothetical protein